MSAAAAGASAPVASCALAESCASRRRASRRVTFADGTKQRCGPSERTRLIDAVAHAYFEQRTVRCAQDLVDRVPLVAAASSHRVVLAAANTLTRVCTKLEEAASPRVALCLYGSGSASTIEQKHVKYVRHLGTLLVEASRWMRAAANAHADAAGSAGAHADAAGSAGAGADAAGSAGSGADAAGSAGAHADAAGSAGAGADAAGSAGAHADAAGSAGAHAGAAGSAGAGADAAGSAGADAAGSAGASAPILTKPTDAAATACETADGILSTGDIGAVHTSVFASLAHEAGE